MQAPSGQMTAPALQALLQDEALTGSWIRAGPASG
jgi:hypothetical protein